MISIIIEHKQYGKIIYFPIYLIKYKKNLLVYITV